MTNPHLPVPNDAHEPADDAGGPMHAESDPLPNPGVGRTRASAPGEPEPSSSGRDSELRELLATLTHELRQPSLGIAGLLKLLHADCADRLGADHRRTLELAMQSAERMKSLVDHLGELVTVEETPVLPERIVLCDLVESLVEYHRPLAERYGTTVETHFKGENVAFLSAFQIREALSNLIQNALIHGSRVEQPGDSGAPRVTITCEHEPGVVRIAVADNGPGIASKDHQKVFQLFARNGNDPDRPGMGMGLTVARRLMSRIDGTIGLTSESGRGTTFTLAVPVERT